MNITVKMFGRFRQQFWDQKEIPLYEGVSVLGTVKEISGIIPDGATMLFDDKGNIRNHIILMVNQKRIAHADCSTTVLHDGDELAVLPPVAGG